MCKESKEDTDHIFLHKIASLLLNIAWFAMKTVEEPVICRRIPDDEQEHVIKWTEYEGFYKE